MKDSKERKDDDNLNKNINDSSKGKSYEYNYTSEEYNYNYSNDTEYDYSYSQDYSTESNELTNTDMDTNTDVKIKSTKINSNIKFDIKVGLCISSAILLILLFTFTIYPFISTDKNLNNTFSKYSSSINDFSTEAQTIGTLPDGRNLYLHKLPLNPGVASDLENTVNILEVYKNKVIFNLENITDTEYIDTSVLTYDLKIGETKTVLNAPDGYYDLLINDKYIVFDTGNNVYLYNLQTDIGEYLLESNPDRHHGASFNYDTILIEDIIFYIYEDILYSYHIPTKETTTLNSPPSGSNFKFIAHTNDYLLIEPYGSEDFIEKAFILSTSNPSEIIPLPPKCEVKLLIDTGDSLVFPNTKSNDSRIDLSFDKKSKKFTTLKEDFPSDEISLRRKFAYDDLIFGINSATPEDFALEVYSIKIDEITVIDLMEFIDVNEYIDLNNYGTDNVHLFNRSDYTRYSCSTDGVLITHKIKEPFSEMYFISVDE
ncbi:MAG: hypothetical protein ACRCWG_11095 [Sarcina sp.]